MLGVDARFECGPLDIVISNDRIDSVRPTGQRAPQGEAIDARNRLVVAGLINGHHHSHEHYYKGAQRTSRSSCG